MILFFAGTKDARELAIYLKVNGFNLLSSVVSAEAADNLRDADLLTQVGRLNEAEIADLINKKAIKAVVDATHPYADKASINAIAGARLAGVPYIRYERPSVSYEANKKLLFVDSYEKAALLGKKVKGTILLTTGSKTLEIFTGQLVADHGVNLIVRLLPTMESIEKCQRLNIDKKNIIAIQGPFTYELNLALFKHYNVDVLITKETGAIGSMDEKIKAALDLGITTIIIARPKIAYPLVFSKKEDVLAELQGICKNKPKEEKV